VPAPSPTTSSASSPRSRHSIHSLLPISRYHILSLLRPRLLPGINFSPTTPLALHISVAVVGSSDQDLEVLKESLPSVVRWLGSICDPRTKTQKPKRRQNQGEASPSIAEICKYIELPSLTIFTDTHTIALKLKIQDQKILDSLSKFEVRQVDGKPVYIYAERGYKQPSKYGVQVGRKRVFAIVAQVVRDRITRKGSVCRGLSDNLAELCQLEKGIALVGNSQAWQLVIGIIVHSDENPARLAAMRRAHNLVHSNVYYFLGGEKVVCAADYEAAMAEEEEWSL
jgi:hypothetical protein